MRREQLPPPSPACPIFGGPSIGGGTLSVEYRYNPLGWRVFEHEFQQIGPNNPVTDRRRWVYFSPSWQELVELEDRTPETTGNPAPPSVDRTTQQFWGLRNVNDAILRRCDTNADGEWDGGDEEGGSGGGTYNQLTDSLFSVIAHVRSWSGDVLCRFSYAVCSGAERTNTGSERVGRARPSTLASGSA